MVRVGITANPTTLVEDEGTATTITFNVTETIPIGGLLVSVVNPVQFSLGDFDVLPPAPQATFTGGRFVRASRDNNGFEFRILENVATITLPIFNDDDLALGAPGFNRNEDIGVEQSVFVLQPGTGYTVDSASDRVSFTIADTRSQLSPLPPPPPGPSPVNRSPVALSDQFSTAASTTLTVPVATSLLLNDSDPDGNLLTATLVTVPSNGSLTLNPDGSFAYTPNVGFVGTDTFAYQATDGSLGSTAIVSIQVFSPAIVGTPGRDRLRGTPQRDVISGLGGNDRLFGLGDNDEIQGGAGSDILLGGNGNDFLVGDSDDPRIRGGNDRIEGGKGNDILFGNTGINTLIGGRGRDLFVLEKQAGHQIIQDFQNRQDRIRVDGVFSRQLEVTQRGRDTIIRGEGDLLAILKNVRVDRITAADFA